MRLRTQGESPLTLFVDVKVPGMCAYNVYAIEANPHNSLCGGRGDTTFTGTNRISRNSFSGGREYNVLRIRREAFLTRFEV